jgi:hypothetical protein
VVVENGARDQSGQICAQLARIERGTPSGFGGRTCHQAIPSLQMERLGKGEILF